ncbi:glycosyltransferase [Halobiforma nitratireducens]|uniref:Glycosyltransferase, type 2 n=1 Tax=Halobiforma nitratireducens JCM 10879 TaxID=1227454 RepID=M0LPB1_9EURY|nr:glycosyltransferase [Halobiforma nitratireducens]EMA35336.1 glycosyltransferase, type 2 [Halobiforma nitratireducens JCM 10879]
MTTADISIIIPVYNDARGIDRTLRSLLSRPSRDIEIVVVDNDSSDDTPTVVDNYTHAHEEVSLVFERDVQSSYAARNTGIDHAESDRLCFLDADQRVTDGWLENSIDRLTDRGTHYLAPNVELEAPDDPSPVAQYNLVSGFPIEDFLEHHHYAPTSCLFVTRDLLEEVGQFDERLVSGGDLEFGNRVYRAGYDLEYAPESTVIHPTRDSFRSLFSRNVRIGRGHCQLQRYYPDRYGRVGIPPRPSGIRREQYDESMNRGLYTAISVAMTAARGFGYYRECSRILRDRLKTTLGAAVGRSSDS